MALSKVERPVLIRNKAYACMVLHPPAAFRCALPRSNKESGKVLHNKGFQIRRLVGEEGRRP